MVVAVYTDGACPGNGKRSAIAGWAWAAWPGGVAAGEPAHSASGKPPGVATNQRAELTALLEGLRWSADAGSSHGPATFYTDSMYSIQCMTKWGPGWRRKGWKRDSGEPLQNLDLIQPMVELWLAEYKARGWAVQHVRGHQTGRSPEAWGNNWVDRAAVAACGGSGCGSDYGLGQRSGGSQGSRDIGHLISNVHVSSPTAPRITATSSTVESVSSEADLDFLIGPSGSGGGSGGGSGSVTGSEPKQTNNSTTSSAFRGFASTRPTDLRKWFGSS
jgi:ribonuclease HI